MITDYDVAKNIETFEASQLKWNSFCNEINISKEEDAYPNDKSISNIDESFCLYQDALRRIQKKKSRKSLQNMSLDLRKQKSKIMKEKSREKTEANTFLKLKKDVAKAMEKLNFSIRGQISYIQSLEVMNELGFLKYQKPAAASKPSPSFLEERSLLSKMWDLLAKEKNQEGEDRFASFQDFLKFLAGVIGLKPSKPPDFSEIVHTNPDDNGCPTFNRIREEKNTDPLDHKRIHKEFEVFARNRLAHKTLVSTKNEPPKIQNISKKSESLALRHYQKVLEQNENVENVAYYERLARCQAATQAKILQKSIENSKKILEKCPFKPTLKKPSDLQPKFPEKSSQESSKKPKILKKTEEIEYERQINECTFKPRIRGNYFLKENTDEKLRIQQQKSIERVEKARIERSFIRSFKERGLPLKNEVFQEIGNLCASKINPTLVRKYFGKSKASTNAQKSGAATLPPRGSSPAPQQRYPPEHLKSKIKRTQSF